MIERLESRIAPAVDVFSIHNTAYVQGTPEGPITISELADGRVQVIEGNIHYMTGSGLNFLSLRFTDDINHGDVVDFHLDQGFLTNAVLALGGGDNTVSFVSGGDKMAVHYTGFDGSDTVNVQSGATLR